MSARLVLILLALTGCLLPARAMASERIELKPLTHEVLLAGVYSDQWVAWPDLIGIGDAAGRKISLTGTFHHLWESEHGIDNTDYILEQAWSAQTTPVANLEIMAPAAAIASGTYDDQIAQWAGRVKAWTDKGGGRSLLLAPLQEMNGNWVPYGMDPAGFKAAYRRIVEIARDLGLDETKVRWVFAPNAWSVAPYSTSEYYPGDDIVDFVGISVYNFGSGVSRWTSVWDSGLAVLDELRSFAPYKPFLITQVGSSTTGGDRDAWLSDLFQTAAWDPNVVGLVYFNFHKETDWKLWDGSNLAEGWREGMRSTAHIWPLSPWFQPGPLDFTPYLGRFADDDQLTTQGHVEWLAERGIINGCTERHFCPQLWVRREEVAAFLVRALDLPPAGRDFFADDAGSPHEGDINAIAAAGFAQGCGADTFCPTALVSRQQLAGMLGPALALTPQQTRQLGDVTGTQRDPWGAITRQEMATILRLSLRALVPEPVWGLNRLTAE